MSIIQISSNPTSHDESPSCLAFLLEGYSQEGHFPDDSEENPPDIDQWHDQFEDWIGFAGRPSFVGRIVDPNPRLTYKQSTEITPAERHFFLDRLHLPNGEIGSYEKDVFPKAVEHVIDQWAFLSEGISKTRHGSIPCKFKQLRPQYGKIPPNLKIDLLARIRLAVSRSESISANLRNQTFTTEAQGAQRGMFFIRSGDDHRIKRLRPFGNIFSSSVHMRFLYGACNIY